MSYSRRQLEAFGETLGESVTRREGGRIVYGGGGSSAPSQTTSTQVSDLPDWAKPYAQQTLAGAQSLVFQKDASGNITGLQPYQQYQGERTAQFTPLQQQSFQGAGSLTPSAAGDMGAGLAGVASMKALGTGYNPYQTGQFTGGAAAQYMSPYLEQAMAPQIREATRQADIQRNTDNARAVGMGAFGGSRQAIVDAERERNLGTQIGDIRAQGYQNAFNNAQQQFNTEQQLREQSRQYGAGLGLQGLQTALQGAGQLGQLGAQQFGQQKDVLNLQNQFGTQQQQQVQNILSQQYQDFLKQQQYPYQQMEYLSSLIRGTPTGQVQTMYQPAPNQLSQVAGTALAAKGLGLYKKGGPVKEIKKGKPAGLAELALSKV